MFMFLFAIVPGRLGVVRVVEKPLLFWVRSSISCARRAAQKQPPHAWQRCNVHVTNATRSWLGLLLLPGWVGFGSFILSNCQETNTAPHPLRITQLIARSRLLVAWRRGERPRPHNRDAWVPQTKLRFAANIEFVFAPMAGQTPKLCGRMVQIRPRRCGAAAAVQNWFLGFWKNNTGVTRGNGATRWGA